jgi:RHS repeat-associated protein
VPEVLNYSDMYAFGMPMPGRQYQSSSSYRFGFNGEEKIDEIAGTGNDYDFGARMYDARLGRFLSLDPKKGLLTDLSPYHFALNSPIQTVDNEGEFPILINGRVSNNTERASPSYWNTNNLKTIENKTGYKMGSSFLGNDKSKSQFSGDFLFVDGDKGSLPRARSTSGSMQARVDAKDVWTKLKSSMNEKGEITEQLQVISHSRGGAFAAGYMEALREEILSKAKAEGIGFSYDSNKLIEYSVNLAPHQSNYINYPTDNGTLNVNISHPGDMLSGDDATGNVVNITSSGSDHGNGGFNAELGTTIDAIKRSKTRGQLNGKLKEGFKKIGQPDAKISNGK